MIGLRLKYKIEPLYSDAVFFIKSLTIFRIGEGVKFSVSMGKILL